MIRIYSDGSCLGNPGPGGWGVVFIDGNKESYYSGSNKETTNNRMEIQGAIEGLKLTSESDDITLITDSTYVINTITKNWKRKVNNDLWDILDNLVLTRNIKWEWVKGHSGNKFNEKADKLAFNAAEKVSELTHVDDKGKMNMVDVSGKDITKRYAEVQGSVVMNLSTLEIIKKGELKKGDVITVARTAGITAAKTTPTLIPLCHPVPLSEIKIDIEFDEEIPGVIVTGSTRAEWKTGVEIEAFNAVVIACVTIYDMCKAIDRSAFISEIKLLKKSGGKSGDFIRD